MCAYPHQSLFPNCDRTFLHKDVFSGFPTLSSFVDSIALLGLAGLIEGAALSHNIREQRRRE
ncbi:MAG: hypothetical protein MRJ65_17620 [Candidatus Brocadiaceae bacterium]|nr:hypothetical protein [Candidatus Brocadiaceae bacterium]